MKQLVKLMDDVNGEVLPPLKFFLKTYTKNLTNPQDMPLLQTAPENITGKAGSATGEESD